jgi:hypothetical protein
LASLSVELILAKSVAAVPSISGSATKNDISDLRHDKIRVQF